MPERRWQFSQRIAKIWYRDKMISYPFELALSELPAEEATECILGILQKKGRQPDTFAEWLVWNFGKPIAEKYLLPYNRKIWRRDLSRMSPHWVKGKMPLPELKEILYSALNKDATEREMVHSSYYYPKIGGINGFIQQVTSALTNVRLSSPLMNLEKQKGHFIVNGDIRAKRLVSTIPIPEFTRAVKGTPVKVKRSVAKLDSNSITTILCEQKKGKTLSWLYLPSREFSAHRIVYQGGLANGNCPPGKFAATYEITGRHAPAGVIEGFTKRMLPDELRALRILDHAFTKYAYPVYHHGFQKDMAVVEAWLRSQSVISCGRFAEWKYFNMDHCIERAFEVSDSITS